MGCCLPKQENHQTNSKMSDYSLEEALGAKRKGENKKPKQEPKIATIQPNPSTPGPSDEIDEPDAPPNQGPLKITNLGLMQMSGGLTNAQKITELFQKLKLDKSKILQKFTDVSGFANETTMAVYNLLVKWKNKEANKTKEINLSTLTEAMDIIDKNELMIGVEDLEESTLMSIAKEIKVTDVDMLGIKLGFSDGEVAVILSNEGLIKSIKQVAQGLFMIWKNQVASKSNEEKIDILKKALNDIGERDLINKLLT